MGPTTRAIVLLGFLTAACGEDGALDAGAADSAIADSGPESVHRLPICAYRVCGIQDSEPTCPALDPVPGSRCTLPSGGSSLTPHCTYCRGPDSQVLAWCEEGRWETGSAYCDPPFDAGF